MTAKLFPSAFRKQVFVERAKYIQGEVRRQHDSGGVPKGFLEQAERERPLRHDRVIALRSPAEAILMT
jgi:hypothetical protein